MLVQKLLYYSDSMKVELMKNNNKTKKTVAMFVFLIAGTAFSNTDMAEMFTLEPLRDPFWPVGYFPESWQSDEPEESAPSPTSGTDWKIPTSLIQVSGTSRLGDKAIAIINGDLKEVGDLIEVSYSGRIYQWKLKKINASGTVDIDRVGINSGNIGFHPGDKK